MTVHSISSSPFRRQGRSVTMKLKRPHHREISAFAINMRRC
jgi:hypothetical protein